MARRNIDPDNLMAFQNAQNKVEIKFLGSLLWFTITEGRVALENIEDAIRGAEIDEKYLPHSRCKRDAFRLASKMGECRGIPFGKKRINLLVRDVKTTGNVLVRNLVREVVDAKNVRLKLIPVMRLELSEDGVLTASEIVNEILLEEKNAAENIQKEFDMSCVYFNSSTVRSIVQSILGTCAPVSVRPSGGVYFIPEKYTGVVDQLKTMIIVLNQACGGHNSIYSVPVVDAFEQRELIQDSLEEQVAKDGAELLEEVRVSIQNGDNITELKAKQYMIRAKKLGELVTVYEDALQYQATSARANLDLAQKGIVNLLVTQGQAVS
jgi:hypothetical protein